MIKPLLYVIKKILYRITVMFTDIINYILWKNRVSSHCYRTSLLIIDWLQGWSFQISIHSWSDKLFFCNLSRMRPEKKSMGLLWKDFLLTSHHVSLNSNIPLIINSSFIHMPTLHVMTTNSWFKPADAGFAFFYIHIQLKSRWSSVTNASDTNEK